jgi:hypothetical protein
VKILTGGCSFSAHLVEEKLAWPYHLEQQGFEIFNSAEMASGNQIISDRICWALEKQYYDYCIVMWSNPYRFELFLNRENLHYNNIHDTMKSKTSYTNFFLKGESKSHIDSNWVRTGGGYGLWNFGNKSLDSLTENYLKNHFNYEYQFIQTCRSIIMVQLLCKSLNVKLINTCWQNIWDDLYDFNNNIIGSNWINSSALESLKKGTIKYKSIIDRYPNAVHWYNLIDWSTWVFYETSTVKRGGLGEFAVIENNDVLDQSHPSRESQNKWANFILENIKC